MYKGAIQYSKLTVFLSRFFFWQNDVEAPAYLRTPGYAPDYSPFWDPMAILLDQSGTCTNK